MKVAKRTAQAFASIVVLSLLMTGSLFAYSTRLSHISSFAAPSPLADDKSSTTKTSTSETEHGNNQVSETTHTNEGEQGEHTLQFKLVAVGTPPVGKGDAEVQFRGTDIRVGLQIEQALKSGSYTVALIVSTNNIDMSGVLGSCSGSIGPLMTSDEGEAEAKLTTSHGIGTFFVALVVCTGGSPALVSDPLTRQVTITQTTTKSETEETNEVNTKEEDQKDQDDIKSAEDSKQIPAKVEVSSSDATITQIDSKFSVSVSRPSDNSLSVS